MDAAAGDQFHCQTNAASVALKDSHAAKRANAETALLSAQQTRALQEARHRAEMAEAEARRINNRRARPWRGRQFRELKKIIISAPRECPIDLFGPRTNRTPLERLHCRFLLASALEALARLWPVVSFLRLPLESLATRAQEGHSTPAIDAVAAVRVSAYPQNQCCLSDHKQSTGSLGAH